MHIIRAAKLTFFSYGLISYRMKQTAAFLFSQQWRHEHITGQAGPAIGYSYIFNYFIQQTSCFSHVSNFTFNRGYELKRHSVIPFIPC